MSVSGGLPSSEAPESNEATTSKKGEQQRNLPLSILSC